MKSVHSPFLCLSQTAGSFSHSKQYTKVIQLGPVHLNQHRITTLPKKLVFASNIQNPKLTGQHTRPCTCLSRKSSCRTSQNRRKNWGYRRARNPSGRLMFGPFIAHKHSEIG